MSPPDVNSPITGNRRFPSPCGAKTATLCCPPHTVRCRSRTLLQTGKFSHPLNHWCIWYWLQALSSVLKLGKGKPCRPVGCSPTIGGAARRPRKIPWAQRCQETQDGEWKVSGARPLVAGVIPGWPSTSMWGPVVTVLDEWGLPRGLENSGP